MVMLNYLTKNTSEKILSEVFFVIIKTLKQKKKQRFFSEEIE